MKKILVVTLLALGLFIPAGGRARTQYTNCHRQTTVSIPTGGFNCGWVSYPLYCYGMPINGGGVAWLSIYYHPERDGDTDKKTNGFIRFYDVLNSGQARVTRASLTLNSSGQVVAAHVTFQGYKDDGTDDNYTGIGDFIFTYTGSDCVRETPTCGGLLNRMMQSGTIVVKYN
jgi:hypothetical protein